jgi:hypothetical protein
VQQGSFQENQKYICFTVPVHDCCWIKCVAQWLDAPIVGISSPVRFSALPPTCNAFAPREIYGRIGIVDTKVDSAKPRKVGFQGN